MNESRRAKAMAERAGGGEMMKDVELEELFGGRPQAVIYDEERAERLPLLPLPEATDSLREMMAKLDALSDALDANESVALRTGFRGTTHRARDPVNIAREGMTPKEAEMYDAVKAGAKLPPIEWANCTRDVPGGKGSTLKYTRAAYALREIYADNTLEAPHASWFYHNKPFAIPLVTAFMKIAGARRNFMGGQTVLTEQELAELQTLTRMNAIVSDKFNQAFRTLNALHRKAKIVTKKADTRIGALRNKMPGARPRNIDTNDRREFVVLKPIDNPVNLRPRTGGVREDRRQLIADSGLTRQPASKKRALSTASFSPETSEEPAASDSAQQQTVTTTSREATRETSLAAHGVPTAVIRPLRARLTADEIAAIDSEEAWRKLTPTDRVRAFVMLTVHPAVEEVKEIWQRQGVLPAVRAIEELVDAEGSEVVVMGAEVSVMSG